MPAAPTRLHDFSPTDRNRGPAIPSALTNNPKAGQWTSERMSHNMVADYKRFLMTDGEGIRCSLYVSGCPFHCVECYNASIWDFRAGIPYTQELEDHIVADIGQSFVQGITFLGGEPLLNTGVLLPLARRLRREFGHDKDIWCWTGYTWEELMRQGESEDKLELLHDIDILVDGRYIKTMHDSLLQFRGSSNQRIIDVPRSFEQGKPVIWAKQHDQERFIPEIYGKDRAGGEGDAS
ncbi:anaerobic ribonucleoside-triphosphate reductase activating protein [Bifidobacterium mongoliense]|uniref:anaerobic ribonucleoside-triphosphate reductase activating protein n=1 Tax=Bifidobacterium mongoliense TaxID=518643 RepID=UPI002647E631|nr:anaerobic ribonucleoside-triphosphate reductase activating protein [Bifidobacterium mongoliense]MDN6025405.1 anaerobic ribonucleoside-triphosphate reductase activating protein [Bifidobacterium mongoliense]MDN6050624.1 anaerobic ribonucleoside-triphosphate reductase activating protein [Bifidobacterium mongoliense]MDN6719395.1 anaerobic ribonucleoside-triphosphate reductase activating protein [Bifidobacterium mongoliense]